MIRIRGFVSMTVVVQRLDFVSYFGLEVQR